MGQRRGSPGRAGGPRHLNPGRSLPASLLLGCATAAHQVEGRLDNDWMRWAQEDPRRIADGADASVACDHYRRFRDDLAELGRRHQTAHRFSVEWARVEPRPGSFDRDALRHYEEVVRACRRHGLEPIVTLHHFTLPRWLADAGGVLHPDTPRLFARYAAACAETFGIEVVWWLTLNEPNVLAFMAYMAGRWPPAEASLRRTLMALRALLRMHAAAARALRSVAARHGNRALVSIAHNERPQRPAPDGSALDRIAAALPDRLFNRWFLRSAVRGRVLPPVGDGRTIAGLRDSLDYIGVNYYTEDIVRFDPRAPGRLFVRQITTELPVSAFGWSIDATGLRRALNELWLEFRLPLLVTENGVADDHDELRPAYLRDHLGAVLDAVGDGVDVRGYLHWTSWDNYEWAEGYTKRFGLFAVDDQSLERVPKPSADLYAAICRERTLPDSL